MEHTIKDTGNADLLSVQLYEDESMLAQEKSISSYSGSIETITKTAGSKTDTFKRFMMSTPQFPMLKINAQTNSTLIFSPPLHSRILSVELTDGFIVQSLAFLTTSSANTVDFYDDIDDIESVNFAKVTGERSLQVSGLGGIESIQLQDGESTKVHADFVVGYETTVTRTTLKRRNSGTVSKLFGDEPTPVYKFTGPGTVHIQARSPLVMSSTLDTISD